MRYRIEISKSHQGAIAILYVTSYMRQKITTQNAIILCRLTYRLVYWREKTGWSPKGDNKGKSIVAGNLRIDNILLLEDSCYIVMDTVIIIFNTGTGMVEIIFGRKLLESLLYDHHHNQPTRFVKIRWYCE
jgi:hypothetical protein